MFAAGEVRATGWGGLEAVSEITGLARSTIGRGLKDLDAAPLPKGRVRRKGGGRRHLSSRDTTLIEDLRNVIEPATLGDPMRPLLWVSKSYDKLASALQKKGHKVSASSVKRLLPTLGYSRQSNRTADEGSKHPDRNAQFDHINAKAIAAQSARQPVISVDTKKKELIGNYKNGGTDYRPKGDPRRVKVHDFEDKELGKVVPYGMYDVGANAGCSRVSFRVTWTKMSQKRCAFSDFAFQYIRRRSSCNAMGAFVISPLASLGQTEFLIGPGPSLRARFAARPSAVPYDPIRLPDAYPSVSHSRL